MHDLCSYCVTGYYNTCPPGYTYAFSVPSCYMTFNVTASWSKAQATCAANGGWLVTIDSGAEDSYIYNLVAGTVTWLGYSSLGLRGSSYGWQQGASTYTAWQSPNPDNYRGNITIRLKQSDSYAHHF